MNPNLTKNEIVQISHQIVLYFCLMEKTEQLKKEFAGFMDSVRFDYQPEELYAPIFYTLYQKGKRLRPMLCLLACEMFGGKIDDALYPALALETFHNSTLIHDDIMDQAPIRRGMETVYRKWNANSAILSGDAMVALAFELVMRTPRAVDTVRLLTKVYREVCEGQQYDMNFETRPEVSIPEYLEMIRLKTAVLLATSLQMGAVVAGADDADQRKLYDFGIAIGMAFQLQDDVLDCYADEAVFGKKTGGDIVENKKTYMLLKARELAAREDRAFLDSLFSSTTVEEPSKKIQSVLAVYDRLHVKEHAEQLIGEYYRQADLFLDSVQLPRDRKTPLRDYVLLLLGRDK